VRRSLARLLLVGVVALGPGSATAIADQGVRISTGRIDVQDPLATGRVYHLPDLEVSNPGTESAAYQMTLGNIAGQDDAAVDPSWVRFTPAGFTLQPGGSRAVATVLAIPADARTGPYQGLLKAELVPAGAGVSIGAAAAARLTFTVTSGTALDSLVGGIRDAVPVAGPLLGAILVLLLVVVVVRAARRRWSFRVERRQ
jgi:hypothetical protein